MDFGHLSTSIRTKLLVSISVVLIGATLVTNLVVTRIQASRLEAGGVEMAASLASSTEALHADLEATAEEVTNLTSEEARASGEALADLLAQVAPGAILSTDFMALISYVRAVNANPGVAYAVYLGLDGMPLTRYLDREKPALQPLLAAADGTPRGIDEVISASRSVDGLWIIEKPVTVEGEPLGTAILCLDRTTAMARLARIEERFDELSAKQMSAAEAAAGLVGAAGRRVAAESALVLWLGAALSVVLVLAVAYVNATAVVHGLGRIITILRGISEGEGDLTQRLEVKSRDELREVADCFNQFVEKTRALISEVKDASIGLAAMAEELSSTTARIADGARGVSAEASAAAGAAEEMSATVADVARSTSEVGEASATADRAARDGEVVILESGKAMEEIAQVVGSATTIVESLGKASDRITLVTDVIHDIADQTNLLALNAAIEAARAGEHGRGFAVVADEVRKLAEKTVRATGEIAGLIEEIKGESARAVAAMEKGNAAVLAGQRFGAEVGTAIAGIRAKVANAAERSAQIAAAIEELAAANEETARSVVGIAGEVGTTTSAAEEISRTSEELAHRSEELRALTARFRT